MHTRCRSVIKNNLIPFLSDKALPVGIGKNSEECSAILKLTSNYLFIKECLFSAYEDYVFLTLDEPNAVLAARVVVLLNSDPLLNANADTNIIKLKKNEEFVSWLIFKKNTELQTYLKRISIEYGLLQVG